MQYLLKGYNFLFFGLLAMFIPFLPVYLKSEGISTSEVGFIIGIGGFVTIIAQPLWGMISDRLRTIRKVMLFLIIIVTIAGYFLFHVESYTLIIAMTMLVYFSLMPLDPLTESLNFTTSETIGISYGSIRTYGALGYAVLSLIVGYIMDWFGMESMSYLFILIGIISFLLVFKMNDVPVSNDPVTMQALKKVLTNKEMVLFLILIFLASVPARMNDTFLGIHIQTLGGDTTLIGLAFFISAASEIVVFALSFWWLRKGKELLVITIAVFFYAVRFFFSALVEDATLLAILQLLQLVTFPIFYTAAIQYLYQIVPREWRATGQTVLALLFFGISGIIASAVGGAIYHTLGGHTFYFIIASISMVACLYGVILLIRKYKNS